MTVFADMLALEQDAINAALLEAIEMLPPSVKEVADYKFMAGGKRLRPILALTTLRMFDPRKPAPYPLAVVLELVHAATLLHDDVLDGADTRRGLPAAHLKFGVSRSILAGDAIFACASKIVAKYDMPSLVGCIADAMMRTVAGEAREIQLRGSLDMGIDTYMDIIIGKTAWLIRAACRMAALYAGAGAEHLAQVSEYGLNLGIAFQIIDDALDFTDEAVTGKPTGGDLREGKSTPPIVFYANSLPAEERAEFARKFAAAAFSDQEIARIAAVIREKGFDRETRVLARKYIGQGNAHLDQLPAGRERDKLRLALNYVGDREK